MAGTRKPDPEVYTDGVHLLSLELEKLHDFAQSVGLKRCWFHNRPKHPHYDLMLDKKSRKEVLNRCLKKGAIKVTSRDLVYISKNFNQEEAI